MQRVAAAGSPAPAPQERPPGRGKLDPYQEFLIGRVRAKPDITMPDLAAELHDVHSVEADPASLSRVLCKAGFSYKKKALMAAERERADVAERRRIWTEKRQPRMR